MWGSTSGKAPRLDAVAAIVAALTLACGDPAGLPAGRFTLTVTTEGGAFDLDGFAVLVDGDSTATVDVNDEVRVMADKGVHWLALGGLAPNCWAGSPSRVTLGAEVEEVRMQAFCVPAPELGAVRILFERPSGLFAMNGDGTDAVRLVSGTGLHAPDVSSDGARLTFVRDTPDGADLWIAAADGQDSQQIVVGNVAEPRWSPDGSEIVYAGYDLVSGEGGITLVSTDGTNASWIARAFFLDDWYCCASWSPDGSRIAFDDSGVSIRIVGRDGSLQPFSPAGRRPVWSADDRIAYVAQSGDVKVVHADGTGEVTVLAGRPGPIWPRLGDWSADGTLLLYTTTSPSGGEDVYLLDVEAGSRVRVTGDGQSRSPVFWPEAG